MNGMVAPEIKVEETVHGYKVSLPLYGLLVKYSANSYYDDPVGQMALVSTAKGAGFASVLNFTKQDGVWFTEEKPGIGLLSEYGPDSLEYAAFEALLKASD